MKSIDDFRFRHEEKVIDSDADDITLVRRVHATIGYVPIHVGLAPN